MKGIALKFCMPVDIAQLYNIYSVFIYLKLLILNAFIGEKSRYWILRTEIKRRYMKSAKRHFLKSSTTYLSENLLEDVESMLNKVLEVFRRYLPPFLSYCKNRGGAESAISSVGFVLNGPHSERIRSAGSEFGVFLVLWEGKCLRLKIKRDILCKEISSFCAMLDFILLYSSMFHRFVLRLNANQTLKATALHTPKWMKAPLLKPDDLDY